MRKIHCSNAWCLLMQYRNRVNYIKHYSNHVCFLQYCSNPVFFCQRCCNDPVCFLIHCNNLFAFMKYCNYHDWFLNHFSDPGYYIEHCTNSAYYKRQVLPTLREPLSKSKKNRQHNYQTEKWQEGHTAIYKAIHRKLKIEQHESH